MSPKPSYSYDVANRGGMKLGGYQLWGLTVSSPIEYECGTPVDHLIQIDSIEPGGLDGLIIRGYSLGLNYYPVSLQSTPAHRHTVTHINRKRKKMGSVPESRAVSRTAVNMARLLLEGHGHVVQEIDGSNDFGEDLYVTFTQGGERTSDLIAIQVKGGSSYRTRRGFRIPVGNHKQQWETSAIPVICVAYDPESQKLYWKNATESLENARFTGKHLKSIRVSRENVLDSSSIEIFTEECRAFIEYSRSILGQLGKEAGVRFRKGDKVERFENELQETLVFWQRKNEFHATLLHSDLDWEPQKITPSMLDFDGVSKIPGGQHLGSIPTIGDIVLSIEEAVWLLSCFQASRWMRDPHFASRF